MTSPHEQLRQDAQSLPPESPVRQFTDGYGKQVHEAADTLRQIQALARDLRK